MKALNPARVALNKIYPAQFYARPAIAPLALGVGGQVGLNTQQNVEMYKYTLQQMAVSPFSVNSEEYMKRIRNEYGYADNGMYETMGVFGGVVGVGVGAYARLGGVQSVFSDKWTLGTMFKKSSYQSPFVNIFSKNAEGNTIAKQELTSKGFNVRIADINSYNKFIAKNPEAVVP